MKSRLATYLTSILLAMVMILSSGFEVCAEQYDFETEIELSESISASSVQENIVKFQTVENKPIYKSHAILHKFNCRLVINLNLNPVNIQKKFCNFRE